MIAWKKLRAAALVILLVSSAAALADLTPQQIRGSASLARDLEFPAEPSRISIFTAPRMAVFKPEGEGPFPALVLFHQCGGLGTSRRQNMSMLNWAKEGVTRGYVVLLIDSLGPRGVDTVCMGPRNGVTFSRGVKDALQAAAHLAKFNFVDRKRIAFAGYSWGAMVGLLASSNQWASALGAGERFAAVVSFYPGCFTIRPPNTSTYEIVNADIDRPLLVLMGGKDTETPAAECASKLEAVRATGSPVELHLYPEATHCFDCEQLDGFAKTDIRGNHVVYHYDKAVTEDARRRMFEFLQKTLGAQQ